MQPIIRHLVVQINRKLLCIGMLSALLMQICYAQQESRVFDITVKAGASIGGSRPGSFRNNGNAYLLFNPTAGIQFTFYLSSTVQLCMDVIYIRKGINCPVEFSDKVASLYAATASASIIENTPNTDFWIENDYIEIPLTIGFTWGYDICRTRLGGYIARRIHSRGELLLNGLPEGRSHLSDIDTNLFNPDLAKYDAGIKIANEFFLNDFALGVEFTGGFVPVIRSSWRANDHQSYTMAVAIYATYRF